MNLWEVPEVRWVSIAIFTVVLSGSIYLSFEVLEVLV